MQQKKIHHYIENFWTVAILPTLMEYLKIPNQSPHFDLDWQNNGYMQQAVELFASWCKKYAIAGMQLEILQEKNHTPLLVIEIPGEKPETILLYGHLDKQPAMQGWAPDLHPFKPVLKQEKLYGRGAADDGYALFAAFSAFKALKEYNIPHARAIIVIEASEESGSMDLPFYMETLKTKWGEPNLIICLDSGCGNYEQLWLTTSLRGLINGELSIEVLEEGIHSGLGSGIVPSCMRIFNQLIARIENEITGEILLSELHTEIPQIRQQQAQETAKVLGTAIYQELPFIAQVKPETLQLDQLLLRKTWQPALAIIGNDGMPSCANAGNVTLPKLKFKLSLRLPPTLQPEKAAIALKDHLEKNPPYQAKVSFTITDQSQGWHAPLLASWLQKSANHASLNYFNKPVMFMGEGGSIPFMNMLSQQFPQAQFVITGVLGPHSNAHGPNEFLHLPMAQKLSMCLTTIIYDHFTQT